MVNKQGSYKTKLPTQYRSKSTTKKKKVLKKEGDKLNYTIVKCPVCNKRKMQKYDFKQEINNELVHINECKNCKFINSSTVVYQKPEYPHNITYFNPKPLEDINKQK